MSSADLEPEDLDDTEGAEAPPEITAPHMTPIELAQFKRLLGGATHYLEFGCGGSTVLAASYPLEHIWSLDSDKAWIENCKRQDSVRGLLLDGRITFHHVKIGPTRRWGYPDGKEYATRWPNYYLSIWQHLDPKLLDLILIDGRWRVQCTFQSLLRVNPDCILAMHDFSDKRPEYRAILEFVDVLDQSEKLITFRRKADIDWQRLALEMPNHMIKAR
ncbi:MAG TPA: hypothetical protein VHL34_14950 [Rhizomicrobium sp.]|jgi:hypothetical protein|nr:hypothetical protein [Rhizomicrobium sp.]